MLTSIHVTCQYLVFYDHSPMLMSVCHLFDIPKTVRYNLTDCVRGRSAISHASRPLVLSFAGLSDAPSVVRTEEKTSLTNPTGLIAKTVNFKRR